MFPKNEVVTIDSLIKFKIVEKNDAKHYGVKVLGSGNLNTPLTINVKVSKSAAEKIKKAGGKILAENPQ
jgi:ribosomal protein L15